MGKDDQITLSMSDLKRIVDEAVASRVKNQAESMDTLRDIVRASKPVVTNNPEYSEITPFTHPEGERHHPGPKLTRKTFFCGGREREETMTIAEVEAYNAITESCTARGGLWQAEVRGVGGDQLLHIYVPSKTIDQRAELPSLLEILRELKSGQRIPSATTLMDRVTDLERQLAALENASAQAVT